MHRGDQWFFIQWPTDWREWLTVFAHTFHWPLSELEEMDAEVIRDWVKQTEWLQEQSRKA